MGENKMEKIGNKVNKTKLVGLLMAALMIATIFTPVSISYVITHAIAERTINTDFQKEDELLNYRDDIIISEDVPIDLMEINREIWDYLFETPFNPASSSYELLEPIITDPPNPEIIGYIGENNNGEEFTLSIDNSQTYDMYEIDPYGEMDPEIFQQGLDNNFEFTFVVGTLVTETEPSEVVVSGWAISYTLLRDDSQLDFLPLTGDPPTSSPPSAGIEPTGPTQGIEADDCSGCDWDCLGQAKADRALAYQNARTAYDLALDAAKESLHSCLATAWVAGFTGVEIACFIATIVSGGTALVACLLVVVGLVLGIIASCALNYDNAAGAARATYAAARAAANAIYNAAKAACGCEDCDYDPT